MKSLVVLVVLGAVLKSGLGLRCIKSQCSTLPPGMPTPNCTIPPREKTCGNNEVCLTQTWVISQQTTIKKDCSMSEICKKEDQMCESLKNTTGASECEMKCCSSELCNSGDVRPSLAPASNGTKVPSGKDLTCFTCETSFPSNETSNATSCDNPVEMKCGMGNDRCLTAKSKAKHPATGKVYDLEVRGCSTSMNNICRQMCKHLNSTGILETCDVKCCIGNKCNGDAPLPTTPAPPKAGQTESAMVNMVAIVTGILVALYSN